MNKRRTQSRFRQIYDDLRGQITSAHLRPGDRLATESELAAVYGVSVLTVRQAQGLLVDDGLISKQQGRGTFVAEAPANTRRVLLACGISYEEGIGPSAYYTQTIRSCREYLQAQGMTMEVAWLENNAPATALPYCEPDKRREYAGFIFLGCSDSHPLLNAARDAGAHWVQLGRVVPGPHRVWMDVLSGVELAVDSLRQAAPFSPERPLVLVTMPKVATLLGTAMHTLADHMEHIEIPHLQGVAEFEIAAYRAIRNRLAHGTDCALLFMDDVLARGGTRAVLEAQTKRPFTAAIAVMCTQADVIPYGLPVHYVIHDAVREAHDAADCLLLQIADGTVETRRGAYRLLGQLTSDELDHMTFRDSLPANI